MAKVHLFDNIAERRFKCLTCLDDDRGARISVTFLDGDVQLWHFSNCPECAYGDGGTFPYSVQDVRYRLFVRY